MKAAGKSSGGGQLADATKVSAISMLLTVQAVASENDISIPKIQAHDIQPTKLGCHSPPSRCFVKTHTCDGLLHTHHDSTQPTQEEQAMWCQVAVRSLISARGENAASLCRSYSGRNSGASLTICMWPLVDCRHNTWSHNSACYCHLPYPCTAAVSMLSN